jgi:predicted dehydrogenase
MRKLRLGIIGAGAWTVASHLPNLERRRAELDFVVVNRRDPIMRERIQRRFGFEMSSADVDETLAVGLDLCVIGSPARFHYEHARAALESGAHVLVEKPFTIKPTEAWDLAALSQKTGRNIVVAYGANYQPMVRQAKHLMEDSGGLGEIEHVMIHMASVTRELLAGAPHRFEVPGYEDAGELLAEPGTSADPALSGGGYAQAQLSHALGLGLWLTGLRGKEVYGRTWPSTPGAVVELHDAAVLTFDNGAIGTLSGGSCHWGAGKNRHQQEVRVIGSLGQLHIDVEREIVWRYRGPSDDIRIPVKPGDGDYECRGPIDALIDLAAGRDVVNASPAELGARTVEIIDALYRSANQGRSVEVH